MGVDVGFSTNKKISLADVKDEIKISVEKKENLSDNEVLVTLIDKPDNFIVLILDENECFDSGWGRRNTPYELAALISKNCNCNVTTGDDASTGSEWWEVTFFGDAEDKEKYGKCQTAYYNMHEDVVEYGELQDY